MDVRTRICRPPRALEIDGLKPVATPGRAVHTTHRAGTGEAGFTLAGLLVICTILMIFVAYTVPRQWTTIMKREREKQTIFVMKQYARSIKNFQTKNGNALPTSLDQLKKARTPRLIRGVTGEWNDPLTGKVDWLLVPPQAATPQPQAPTGTQGNQTPQQLPAVPKDYVGPFVGVRPPLEGASLLSLNGADHYEQWLYTINELNNEINGLMNTQLPQTTTNVR
ncbi:MAG: type II secretion system protein [Thermoanaerobaculia bacterium]